MRQLESDFDRAIKLQQQQYKKNGDVKNKWFVIVSKILRVVKPRDETLIGDDLVILLVLYPRNALFLHEFHKYNLIKGRIS